MVTQQAIVHWMYGIFLAVVGGLALATDGRHGAPRSLAWAWPTLLLAASVLLFLDPWVMHGYRGGLAGAAAQVENVQHWQLATMMLLLGGLQLARVRGWLSARVADWAWIVTVPAAALLFVHAQPGGGAELALALLQHRLMAVVLLALGVSGVLAGYRPERWLTVRNVLLLVLAGLLLAFTDIPGVHAAH